MSAGRIRRGEQPRSRVRAPGSRKRGARPSWSARALAKLPFDADAVRHATAWTGVGLVAVALIAAAHFGGLFNAAWVSAAEAMGRAGLRVEHVDVQGLKRMDGLTVYAVALDQKSTAMPLVELEPIRQRLLSYGWIADARVSRRLPDTLVVDIVEREPAAVWQSRGRLVLIDPTGVVLAPVGAEAMPDLPLVIGPQANLQTARLERLLTRTPSVRPMLAAASWIGGRRWDLRFQSGEVLALPEGDEAAQTALIRFAGMDARERLLGRGYQRFDMRDPTRMVVRVNRGGRTIDEGADMPAMQPEDAVDDGDGAAAQVARIRT